MAKGKYPVTAAVRVLREHGVAFTHHPYEYEERGGTVVSARELGVPEHAVVKTLVMEDDRKEPLIVLMHGDREVSTKNLARFLGVKIVTACSPAVADRHSGYQVGGTSPVRHAAAHAGVHGAIDRCSCLTSTSTAATRGYLVGMTPADLVRVLDPVLVEVAA